MREWRVYRNKDAANIKPAITITISKFGPSGSSKKKNSSREERMDVIPSISSEILFDLKYMI